MSQEESRSGKEFPFEDMMCHLFWLENKHPRSGLALLIVVQVLSNFSQGGLLAASAGPNYSSAILIT